MLSTETIRMFAAALCGIGGGFMLGGAIGMLAGSPRGDVLMRIGFALWSLGMYFAIRALAPP